jgi:hypothetical protein
MSKHERVDAGAATRKKSENHGARLVTVVCSSLSRRSYQLRHQERRDIHASFEKGLMT